jgi:pimeloyl-ACP methyl ester carboxylesterase
MASSPAAAEPAPLGPPSGGRGRGLRLAGIAAGALIVLALAAAALLSWHYSSAVVVPDHGWSASVDVRAVSPARIVLGRSDESERPGIYGLVWRGGNAIVGPVIDSAPATVTRRLTAVDGYLVPGVDADIDTDVFNGDPRTALGVRFARVAVNGELGRMPAWIVTPDGGPSRTWAIVVHGLNATPREGLRLVPPLRRLGITSMLISYREDLGAPQSPDGLHHLGQTEWHDLQAAARYALAHGARRLVLVGYSMGGEIVAQFMEKSTLAPRTAALVLDAPVLDWRAVLEHNATETGFPAVAATPLEWAIDARVDTDWDSLDALAQPESFQLPILLFQGREDELVPISSSDEFAAELGPHVTYYEVAKAGHTQAWNVDPGLYDRRLTAFLRAKGLAAASGAIKKKDPTTRVGSRIKNRRRPTLPGGCPPSTIGAEWLNCSVRNGKRCFPLAMHHRNFARHRPRWSLKTAQGWVNKIRQALDPLVPVSYAHYCTSTAGLSTWWSTRGLTPSKGWESSSRGRLPA